MIEIVKPLVTGIVRVTKTNMLTGKIVAFEEKKNLVLYRAADLMAQAITGNDEYKISSVYFEYDNSNTNVPSFTREDGESYYNALPDSPTGSRDFLRIPIAASPSFSVESGSTGTSSSSSSSGGGGSAPSYYLNNIVTFYAVTSGEVGIKGHSYSDGISNVLGAALVATPVQSDQAQDKVFSRTYFSSSFQKEPNHQIAVQWALQFNVLDI